jgi:hypothetical protein
MAGRACAHYPLGPLELTYRRSGRKGGNRLPLLPGLTGGTQGVTWSPISPLSDAIFRLALMDDRAIHARPEKCESRADCPCRRMGSDDTNSDRAGLDDQVFQGEGDISTIGSYPGWRCVRVRLHPAMRPAAATTGRNRSTAAAPGSGAARNKDPSCFGE